MTDPVNINQVPKLNLGLQETDEVFITRGGAGPYRVPASSFPWEQKGDKGDPGGSWAPVLSLVTDGVRRVHRIVGWVGGTGVEPTTTGYIGAAGIVSNVAEAVDVRGLQGNAGWAPVLALVADGDRRVHQVIDWTGGAGAKPGVGWYVGATGLVELIQDAVNVRGATGGVGWSPVLAVVPDGNRRVQQIVDWIGGAGTKPTALGYVGTSGIVATAALAADVSGAQGNAGWAPVLAIVADGERRVPQVVDWTGGAGTKPETLGYVGEEGIVSTAAAAVDVRGLQGVSGWAPVLAIVADGERRVLQVVDWTGGAGTKPATLGYIGAAGIVATAAAAVDVRGSGAVTSGSMLLALTTATTSDLAGIGYLAAKYLGVQASVASLYSEYPPANNSGARACVGAAAPYLIYESNGQDWIPESEASPATLRAFTGAASVALLGSSIEYGSSATNAGSTSYGPQTKSMSNQLRVSSVTRRGYPGQPSAYIAAQIQSIIEEGFTHIIIGAGFGTNSFDDVLTGGVYQEYGRHIEMIALRCKAAGIKLIACTGLPVGISSGRYAGTTASVGTTTTAILPVGASATDRFYIGGQIELAGDGVIRVVRSYDATTRTVGFTPAASAAVAAGTAFVICGAGDAHRGAALQALWLSSAAPRLGIPLIDTRTAMSDARGFLRAEYCTEPDPVHPIQGGHDALSAIVAAAINAGLIEKIKYPVTAFGGGVPNPWMIGPSGSVPGGYGVVGPTTMGGARTHTITSNQLGDAPGNTWTITHDLSAGGAAGNYRLGVSPGIPCVAGERWLLIGTFSTSGVGSASIAAFNNNSLMNISSSKGLTDNSPAETYMAIIVIPSGCTSWSPAIYANCAAGNVLSVSVAGLQATNLTAAGLP